MELFQIAGTLQRGQTRDKDVLVISGLIPTSGIHDVPDSGALAGIEDITAYCYGLNSISYRGKKSGIEQGLTFTVTVMH